MKRRILHVLASPHLGGAEWMCLYLAQGQMRRGHDVRVHLFEAGLASEKAQELGLKTTVQNVATFSRQARRKAFANGLKRDLHVHPPGIIHSHVPLTNLVCHKIAPASGIPWVATIHSSWRAFGYAPQTVTRPYLKPYLLARHALGDRITLRSAARVAAVSEYVRRDLLRIGVADKSIRMIHNGLPLDPILIPKNVARTQMDLPESRIVIGALGFFAPVKGFDILIRAMAKLLDKCPNTRLIIAGGDVLGDQGYRNQLSQDVSTLGLSNHVRLLGAVNPRGGFLSSLDIFVISSRTEGGPLALIEAMQHGLPSVVSSAGGSGEAARDGREALVFQSGNAADLAAKLEQLVIVQSMREKFGQAARQRAESYLSLERCLDEYEQFYP